MSATIFFLYFLSFVEVIILVFIFNFGQEPVSMAIHSSWHIIKVFVLSTLDHSIDTTATSYRYRGMQPAIKHRNIFFLVVFLLFQPTYVLRSQEKNITKQTHRERE